jgi:micrococcal nuclease
MLKKALAVGVVASVVGISAWASKAFYTVERVLDGDTFQVKSGQYIRLDSVDAPEINNCLGQDSKEELEKLILNKKVFIKVNYVDQYKRLIGSVYSSQGNVGEKMLSKGMATFRQQGSEKHIGFLEISQAARDKKIGVYSDKCTQDKNPLKPNCKKGSRKK